MEWTLNPRPCPRPVTWLRAEGRSNIARYGTPIVMSQHSMNRTLDEIQSAVSRIHPIAAGPGTPGECPRTVQLPRARTDRRGLTQESRSHHDREARDDPGLSGGRTVMAAVSASIPLPRRRLDAPRMVLHRSKCEVIGGLRRR